MELTAWEHQKAGRKERYCVDVVTSWLCVVRGLIGIEFESRTVTVLISHVGIEGQQLELALADPRVTEAAAALKAKHAGRYDGLSCVAEEKVWAGRGLYKVRKP